MKGIFRHGLPSRTEFAYMEYRHERNLAVGTKITKGICLQGPSLRTSVRITGVTPYRPVYATRNMRRELRMTLSTIQARSVLSWGDAGSCKQRRKTNIPHESRSPKKYPLKTGRHYHNYMRRSRLEYLGYYLTMVKH
jgi:hypothetical protein